MSINDDASPGWDGDDSVRTGMIHKQPTELQVIG
jgi:hypothetical protein